MIFISAGSNFRGWHFVIKCRYYGSTPPLAPGPPARLHATPYGKKMELFTTTVRQLLRQLRNVDSFLYITFHLPVVLLSSQRQLLVAWDLWVMPAADHASVHTHPTHLNSFASNIS